ncbi:MAG: M61 family peptidase [Candidatus Aminicenantes bacterium]|nr:M61 family peptidase [Candidatus Aminicenantes bacterium]
MMMKRRMILGFLLMSMLALPVTSRGGAVPFSMAYTVSVGDPAAGLFHVELRCDGWPGGPQSFRMPVWMPGYYGVMDYPSGVQGFLALDGRGRPLFWEKSAADAWRVQTGRAARFTIRYDIKVPAPFITQSGLNEKRAYIAPPGVFLYPDRRLGLPVIVTIDPGPFWKDVATGLDPVPGRPRTFAAPDFDALYDSPFLIGNLERLSFEVRGVPHAFYGFDLGEFDRSAFVSDLKRLVEAAVSIFGEIPYKRYAFLAVGPGRGGIEHAGSMAVSLGGLSGYSAATHRGTLKYLAHEYFHHYNVKRIRPFELGPFDYSRPNRTRMLWMAEGFTVYYETIVMRRAGFLGEDEMLAAAASPITAVERRPGRLVQSAAESSYVSWDQGPFGGDPATTVSYYDKGAVIGLLLDLAIRKATAGARSLDDVMRALYKEYYREKGRGFTEAELRAVCEKTAGETLSEVFSYADTAKPVDYAKYLGCAGLALETVAAPPTAQTSPSGRAGQAAPSVRIVRLPDPTPEQAAILRGWLGR